MNIIYFVCHDLGRHLGCYGVPFSTPNLDRFASESLLFKRAFCASPACSPSRACAMTGRYAHATGAIGLSHMGWPLDLRHNTIVDDLNAAGYDTILSGVNHERHPLTDRYQTDLTRTWSDWNSENAVGNAIAHLEKMETRDSKRPFYLNIGTQEPHASTWKDVGSRISGPVPSDQVFVPHCFPDNPSMRVQLGRFQAAILHMDKQFGRLMDALDRLGLREKTLVVFTTDHGIAGPRAKSTLYEFGVETSLIIRMPDGRGAGTHFDGLISNIDLRPTIAEAAGLPAPAECDGRSFFPLLSGQPYTPNPQIFTERNYHGESASRHGQGFIDAYDPLRSIRTDRYHYIRWSRPERRGREPLPWEVPGDWEADGPELGHCYPPATEPRRSEELYKVDQDPCEWINLAERPEFAEIKADLAARLDAWQHDTGDFDHTNPPTRPEPEGWGEGWPLTAS